tara:strand:+ start:4562 stop:5287 length:726 start_codon:yes stop_codon:yes gene_type:complete
MTKIKLLQGILPGNSTPREFVEKLYIRKNIIVPEKDEIIIPSTDNSFNLTIPYDQTEFIISKIDYPKSFIDKIQPLHLVAVSGSYGQEVSLIVREMSLIKFINFLEEYKLDAESGTGIVQENLIQQNEVKQKTNKSINNLILDYRYIKNQFLNTQKYYYKTKDSLGNTWGSSESFYREQIKTISFKNVIDDTTSTNKDGFTLNETYYLFLSDENEDIKLSYTATSSLALDKGIITINTLSL